MLASFVLGALGYPVIELCYRRRTHPSMALAGGAALCGLRALHRARKARPLLPTALLGGLLITGVEFLTGQCVNRRYQVWDYRKTPLNLRGQICLPFTLAWCGLSAAALWVMRAMDV